MMDPNTISNEKFAFTTKIKIICVVLVIIGVIAAIFGAVNGDDHGQRFWANFLLNNYYFLVIALGGVVFIVLHNLGNSGWQVAIQRVPEAMSSYLLVGSILMMIVIIGLAANFHHLFHWAHLHHPDPVIEGKKAFLNIPFFTIRSVVYLAGWTFLAWMLRKYSLMQDTAPDNGVALMKRSLNLSGWFIVFFAITSSVSAWDWVMSLDPHWYSTLFAWYLFSGLLVSSISVIILLIIFLKKQGYLAWVNKEHMHDLGKYLFAFSILWAYLWFSQFMLIWYANIPEETTYFVQRLEEFRPVFFANLIINFAIPFLALMTRNSKRGNIYLALVAIVTFCGHWLDYYMAVMPGTLGAKASIGFTEIGMTIGFIGIFLFVVFRWMSKNNLVAKGHPYFKESLDYHTQY